MSDYKYTTGGKKVIVVGKLNAQDTIVQEIFISDGNEIPSGENFVVKSLHDTPVESWKDRDLKKRELDYETRTTRMSNELNRIQKQFNKKVRTMKDLLEKVYIPESLQGEPFDTIIKFISGEITHVVMTNYMTYEIKEVLERYMSEQIDLVVRKKRRGCDSYMIEAKKKYNLAVPTEVDIAEFYQRKVASMKQVVDTKKDELKNIKNTLKEYQRQADM